MFCKLRWGRPQLAVPQLPLPLLEPFFARPLWAALQVNVHVAMSGPEHAATEGAADHADASTMMAVASRDGANNRKQHAHVATCILPPQGGGLLLH